MNAKAIVVYEQMKIITQHRKIMQPIADFKKIEYHQVWPGIISKGLTAIGEDRVGWTDENPTLKGTDSRLISRQRLRNWIPDNRDSWAIPIVTRKTALKGRRLPWWAGVLKPK